MKTLFLDLASNLPVVALCQDAKVLAIKPLTERIKEEALLPLLESVVKDYKELDRIACIVGPGGFTSLRMAVVCSNTLADQLEIPTASIHLTELYGSRTSEKDYYWIHSTKKDEVFIKGGKWKQSTHAKLNEVLEKLPAKFSFTGELLPEHQEVVKEKGGKELRLDSLEEVLPEFLNRLKYDKTLLSPWYGREW